MKTLTPEDFDAFTRLDFWVFVQRVFVELSGEPFQDNFHIQLLCAEVDRMRSGANVKLAIALPPRSLKSIIISVVLPAWLLGHDPKLEIICVSYGQELADKLSSDCRPIMLTPWYRRLFPATRLDRQAIDHLATSEGGKRYATSVGGPLTGLGADVIIVDDPMKPDEALSDSERNRTNDWARHTLFTRLNNKGNDRIIVVMQRLHEADMIGHLLEFAGFELLAFPAIAQEDEVHLIRTPFRTLRRERKAGEALHPERESLAILEKQRRLLGTEFFAAQYLQSPTPPGGGLVKTGWFNRFDLGEKPRFRRILQSWDCASKATQLSNYSVCTTWGVTENKDMYLLHVFRDRLEYPELKRKLRQLADRSRAGVVLIEEAASGVQLVQELKREGFARITPVKPLRDKVMRMAAQTPAIEAGRIWIPREAPWLGDYLHELAMFPKGKYDDQVDSTSQALEHIGMPNDLDGWLEFSRAATLRRHGLKREQLTVTFDQVEPDWVGQIGYGREIRRGEDGFYHVTPQEWERLRHVHGVTFMEEWSPRSLTVVGPKFRRPARPVSASPAAT
jgi:predicted phage terminase large subunit-like protein